MNSSETLLAVDASMISTYQSCPRKYFLRYILNLDKKTQSIQLEFGLAMHKMLEYYYRGELDEIPKVVEGWTREEENKKYTKQRLVNIFTRYLEKYQNDNMEVVFVEVPFELPICNDHRFLLLGRIDMLVRISGAQFLYGFDNKTTSELGDTYVYRFSRDLPVTGYIWALKKLYGQTKVQGLIINAISTALTAGERARDFERFLVTRSDHELQEFEESTHVIMTEMATKRMAFFELKDSDPDAHKRIFPPYLSSCTSGWGCVFRDYCSSGLSESYKEENLTERPWDPRNPHS